MNFDHFRNLLRAKERDLLFEISELNEEAKRPEGRDVGDRADWATLEVVTNDSIGEAAALTETLAQVRDALQRIEDGTYGTCTVCGRPIEPARLEAIPWTPYCLKHEREREAQEADHANSANRL
jgi:DnaK suppressor protein